MLESPLLFTLANLKYKYLLESVLDNYDYFENTITRIFAVDSIPLCCLLVLE